MYEIRNVKEFIQKAETEFEQDANVVLIYSDAFAVCKLSDLLSPAFDKDRAEKKLLDIRIFDRKKEMRMYRDYEGNGFFPSIILSDEEFVEKSIPQDEKEMGIKSEDFYYDDVQYLDKIEILTEDGVTKAKAAGGGKYRFPKSERGKTKVKLRNYIDYDENGQAAILAWRLVDFI